MRIVFALILVCSVGFAATSKQECEKNGNLLSRLGEVRSQGNVGWCFANSAADLTSFYYGQRVSSTMMALIYNYDQGKQGSSETGYVFNALKTALRPTPPELQSSTTQLKEIDLVNRGFCISSGDQKAEIASGRGLKQKIEDVQKVKNLMDAFIMASPEKRAENKAAYQKHLEKLIKENSILASLSTDELDVLLKNTDKKNFLLYLSDFICRDRSGKSKHQYVKETPEIVNLNSWQSKEINPEDLIREINGQLQRKNILAIDYMSGFLQYHLDDPKAKYIPGSGSAHASVVVGSEWMNNQCHYIIRNSWGPLCTGYRIRNGVIDSYKQEIYSPTIAKCREGNIWVSENVLKENIFSVTYIEK